MNLLSSVITSCIIVGVIWAIAAFQPKAEVANDTNTLLFKPEQEQQNTVAIKPELLAVKNAKAGLFFNSIQISAISQKISLNQLPHLWHDFNNNKTLQMSLKKKPSKVFVFYRDFSSDYSSAMVSIGYDSQELKGAISKINLPNMYFQSLLSKGKYNELQMKRAWEKIDYRKRVAAIVEVHSLAQDSSINSSEIFVSYN